MSLPLGRKLQIRAMVHVAAEPIPFFWPMRTFIHHNPLHGLEHLGFAEAVEQGARLFHARGFLTRPQYQQYLAQGKVDPGVLRARVAAFAADRAPVPGVELEHCLMHLLTEFPQRVWTRRTFATAADVHTALQGDTPPDTPADLTDLRRRLREDLLEQRLLYEAVDSLYGTEIGKELDELVVKSCLDFFDEGQSAWSMPQREQGFFKAWRDVAMRNARLFLRGLHINRILAKDDTPEGIIAHVLETLGVDHDRWMDCFTQELSRLHGWAGFIRWRSSAKRYYWQQRFPGDLVDFMAIRLTLALALLTERGGRHTTYTTATIEQAIEERCEETYLRSRFHDGTVIPALAFDVERALALGDKVRIAATFAAYVKRQRAEEAAAQAARLRAVAQRAGDIRWLENLSDTEISQLLATLYEFERREGMFWLEAMEAHAMVRLLSGINLEAPQTREKRPFVQALFCIDTRSERIRRHLEAVGDYQTFGIAGFFGVPVSFMDIGKGSETHLCPVLLTPKNLVPEISAAPARDEPALTALEKAMHELKESVLTPFVTVEAIGLLFGFDMVGKTLIPQTYNRWRQRLHPGKPATRLLLDKLSREQADSIVRAVQRAVIVKAVEQELGLEPERITDTMIRELREAALGHQPASSGLTGELGLDDDRAAAFIELLRSDYRINTSFAQVQLERLGRIGFSIDEQVHFVAQALRAIGLTAEFSRFVLLVGHGSSSENNPYESALDCGACGGNHGLVSARVLAQMANKPEVRRRLERLGIRIPDDAWFVPALHNTTTDELTLYDLDLLPPSHLVYLDRLRNGLAAASRLCASERVPTLEDPVARTRDPADAYRKGLRNAMDWSQVRPEWGLSRNAYFVIGRRHLTQSLSLEGRAFLHSYDHRVDQRRRLLETILTGPLVVAQWINMEHYFSTVDNERFGSGSKVYHNVAGRFGVMTGNLSDLRTGLPSQTVLKDGLPFHEPLRLVTLIEAPFEHARRAIEGVVAVKHLVENGWLRMLVVDPDTARVSLYEDGQWRSHPLSTRPSTSTESIEL